MQENTKIKTSHVTMEAKKAHAHNFVHSALSDGSDSEIFVKHDESTQDIFKKPVSIISMQARYDARGSSRTETEQHKSRTKSLSKLSSEHLNTEIGRKIEISIENHSLSVPYEEPPWGGLSSEMYKIEVLKSGVILESINLSTKSFHVIGRLPVCDIRLAHPTISRYHAVFQHRKIGYDKNESGLYLYDLESTHGTFVNGFAVSPRTYVKLCKGYIIKFGRSQRKLIVETPSSETRREESEQLYTKLKEIRRSDPENSEEEPRLHTEQVAEFRKLREDGINWGMGEDADPETDPTENPFASSNNEEIFVGNPKKTLRGWFERTGHDLKYEMEEKGVGRFLCWVDLPLNTSTSRTVRAEALVKGRKKEAVIQCAFEACRILDRHGVLRQHNYEGRKRKSRDWESEDFYESDEDNFLDRTGTVERKREQRMKNAGKFETKIETYASLVEKHLKIREKISEIVETLENHRSTNDMIVNNPSGDALDTFMFALNTSLLGRSDIIKKKVQLQNLRKEENDLRKVIDIAKPVQFPTFDVQDTVEPKNKVEEAANEKVGTNPNCGQSIKYHSNVENFTIRKGKSAFGLITNPENLRTTENEENCREDSKEYSYENQQNINSKKYRKRASHNLELPKKKREIHYLNDEKSTKGSTEIQGECERSMYREDYSTWMPPENQSGDGKTSLNDKFGY